MKWLLQLLIYMGLQQMNLRRILLDSTYKYNRSINTANNPLVRHAGCLYGFVSKKGNFKNLNLIAISGSGTQLSSVHQTKDSIIHAYQSGHNEQHPCQHPPAYVLPVQKSAQADSNQW